MSSTAFSSDGVEVIARHISSTFPLDHPTRRKSEDNLRRYYEIGRCIDFIRSDPLFQRVALQFPDFLLCDAAEVTSLLKRETGKNLFILGDTSYGSCCVDEVAAEHAQADCIIHFGPACLTQTRRLPVLYVFGREEIDVDDCVTAFRQLFPAKDTHVLVLHDTAYSHCLGEFEVQLNNTYPNSVISRLELPEPAHHSVQTNHSEIGAQKSRNHCCTAEGCGKQTDSSHTPGGSASESAAGGQRSETNKVKDPEAEDPETGEVEARVQPLVSADSRGVSHGRMDDSEEEMLTRVQGLVSEENTYQKAQEQQHKYKRFGRSFELVKPIDEYEVFYIGFEGPTLTNLILNYSKTQFYSYNPLTRESRRETINVNRALGRRYFLVQKAKEARTVGILVGTLGAADYLDMIERLKKLLKQAGKKYYTIAVGKLNVAKMANFMEIDIFVLVACPENSLVDSQEFYKPIVTPYEMEVACLRSREWTGEFVSDYQELFPGAAFHVPIEETNTEEEPEFSLTTGRLLPSRPTDEEGQLASDALVPRSKMEVALPSAAAEYLRGRSWQGLEQKLGETEVSKAVEGRSGLAASYSHEPYSSKEGRQ